MTMTDEKGRFAYVLQQCGDPYHAARHVFPDDDDKALTAANEWPAELRSLGLVSDEPEIPTRAGLIEKLLGRIENEATETCDYVKGIKVAAEIAGYTKTVVVEKNSGVKSYVDPESVDSNESAEAIYKQLMGE